MTLLWRTHGVGIQTSFLYNISIRRNQYAYIKKSL
nr:MAG TPA: hypothetical protein [Caudoviricetes sp.]